MILVLIQAYVLDAGFYSGAVAESEEREAHFGPQAFWASPQPELWILLGSGV